MGEPKKLLREIKARWRRATWGGQEANKGDGVACG
jgi:hypothetical protein